MTDDSASASKRVDALVCVECGGEDAEVAHGWRAYLFEGSLLVYCPCCAAREFEPDD